MLWLKVLGLWQFLPQVSEKCWLMDSSSLLFNWQHVCSRYSDYVSCQSARMAMLNSSKWAKRLWCTGYCCSYYVSPTSSQPYLRQWWLTTKTSHCSLYTNRTKEIRMHTLCHGRIIIASNHACDPLWWNKSTENLRYVSYRQVLVLLILKLRFYSRKCGYGVFLKAVCLEAILRKIRNKWAKFRVCRMNKLF